MHNQSVSKIIMKAVSQIELMEEDRDWIASDLRTMRISLKVQRLNAKMVVNNKDRVMKQVWSMGKAHELFHKGLLKWDGSLTSGAISYLKRQRAGELPSGNLPGGVYIELGMVGGN